jgi:hypothetical protein
MARGAARRGAVPAPLRDASAWQVRVRKKTGV